MDVSKLIVIWPNNVDSTRTIKKGRRIPKASGCEHAHAGTTVGRGEGGRNSCHGVMWNKTLVVRRRSPGSHIPVEGFTVKGSADLRYSLGNRQVKQIICVCCVFFCPWPLVLWPTNARIPREQERGGVKTFSFVCNIHMPNQARLFLCALLFIDRLFLQRLTPHFLLPAQQGLRSDLPPLLAARQQAARVESGKRGRLLWPYVGILTTREAP